MIKTGLCANLIELNILAFVIIEFIGIKGVAMYRAGKSKLTKLILLISIGILCCLASAKAQERPVIEGWEEEYWQQRADYEINVTLDTEGHTLTGSETVTYKNNSPDTLDVFHLHLYPNAYREKSSQLIRDFMQSTLFFIVGLTKSRRGWIDVTELRVDGETAAFDVDGTILTSRFTKPLLPGQEARIEIAFTEKIRRKIGRAGYAGQHYDMAQWYPKMVVYNRDGWHPDQFRMGEFYGEFGTYDVYITLPEEYVIAASGLLVSGDPGWTKNPLPGGRPGGHPGGRGGKESAPEGTQGSRKTVHFRAENVHDFAWCADPTFVVQDTTWNDVRIMSFFRIWNRSWVDSTLAHGLRTVKWLERIAGPFPYPQISIVDCPTHGGMEYPMLVMNGYADEGLVLHEIGHTYFYGILANDERTEAWMDEGFTQYQMFWYMEEHYGPFGQPEEKGRPRSRLWERVAVPVIDRHRTGFAERVATPVHEFKNGYSMMPYIKAPLFLRALRYTVGDETFQRILQTYVDRWKFKHVDEAVFLSVCEEVSGMELGDLFKQWLHTTKSCDYKMDRFSVSKTNEGCEAEVRIKRKGELIMPLTLAFRLENGNTVSRRVDGLLRTIEERYTFDVKPVSVAINPDNEILDVYQIDNYSPRRRALALDNPLNDYYPDDAFEFRMLPIGHYNDIDGGKAGLRIRGSYDNMYKKFTLQGLYGFESGTVDVYGSFEHPFRYLGRDASLWVEGYYREGRQGGTLTLSKIRRKSLYDPLAKYFTFSTSYQEITDTSYVFPYTYEEGINVRIGMTFSIRPQTDLFATSLTLGLDRSLWGSDFNYEKFSLETRLWPARRYPLPLKPSVRFFLGYSSIDPPLQEMFNLAGAGGLEKERYFWLRSVGAFPKDYYGNFHVPGDGNLRGYYDGDYSFRRLFASNIELELPFPLPVGRQLSRRLDRRLYLFYDWGTVLDERPLEPLPPTLKNNIDEEMFEEILFDAGVGITLWRITAEFPLYVSHPEFTGDEEKWEFRWTVGLKSLF